MDFHLNIFFRVAPREEFRIRKLLEIPIVFQQEELENEIIDQKLTVVCTVDQNLQKRGMAASGRQYMAFCDEESGAVTGQKGYVDTLLDVKPWNSEKQL
jgi:hypothetical protein